MRICEFRAEVEAETFLTPERMDGTVGKLLKVLGQNVQVRGSDRGLMDGDLSDAGRANA